MRPSKVIVMRKLLLLFSFFSLTPALLLFTAIFLVFLSFEQATGGKGLSEFFHTPKTIAYAALPENTNVVSATISVGDVRVGKVLDFLDSYHSPLSAYANDIVTTADKYAIDYRWIPAIAMQESGGCNKVIGNSHNCWGYGIYGKHLTKFDTFQEGIDTVGKYLAKNKALGLDTLDKLGDLYNPTNHNDWKGKVSLFLTQMD